MSLVIFIVSSVLFILITITQYKKKDVTSETKGLIGEKKIKKDFLTELNYEYFIYDNVTIRDAYEYTTQIDHIIVCRYGLFVIETKNYSGWIYASESKQKWVQKFPKKSYEFQNPILQNYRHISVLKFILDSKSISSNIHSLVVFSEDCTFKTHLPHNVFQGSEWINYIQSFDTGVFTENQIQYIKDQISRSKLPLSQKTDSIHLRSIQKRLHNQNHA